MAASEYDILLEIARRKGWWRPFPEQAFFRQDCINYWNEMIEWATLMRKYQQVQHSRRVGFCRKLHYPQRPRKPMRKW